jgi:hypothetical protein
MSALVSTVHVRDEKGTSHVFGPDSDVPEWAQRKITNAAAWDEAPVFEDADDELTESELNEPARSGRGSGLEVWAAYAKSLDITFPEEATRDDLIKLVDEKKAPVGA